MDLREINEAKIEHEENRLELEDELRSRNIKNIGSLEYRDLVNKYFNAMKHEPQINWIPGWSNGSFNAIKEFIIGNPDITTKDIATTFDLSEGTVAAIKANVTRRHETLTVETDDGEYAIYVTAESDAVLEF